MSKKNEMKKNRERNIEICQEYRDGVKVSKLAKKYDMTRQNIHLVLLEEDTVLNDINYLPVEKVKEKKPFLFNHQKILMREERKIAKLFAAGMKRNKIAKKLKISPAKVYKTIQKPSVQTEIEKALQTEGITLHFISKKIKEGLDANKVISANIISQNGEGMKDANSMTKDFIEVPDHLTRHKFIETSLKLKNAYPSETVDVQGSVDIRKIEIVFVKNNNKNNDIMDIENES